MKNNKQNEVRKLYPDQIQKLSLSLDQLYKNIYNLFLLYAKWKNV